MALVLPVNGIEPHMGENTWLAPNATVVGDVHFGKDCSVWFQAVVRGDVNEIRIGDAVNIQDGAVIHCTYKTAATHIGNRVSIGHKAIVHGCTIEDDVLIGMGAIVMDHAVVRSGAIVAAGAVVLERTEVESGWIYAGVPAKKVKAIPPERQNLIPGTADRYIKYARWFQDPDIDPASDSQTGSED